MYEQVQTKIRKIDRENSTWRQLTLPETGMFTTAKVKDGSRKRSGYVPSPFESDDDSSLELQDERKTLSSPLLSPSPSLASSTASSFRDEDSEFCSEYTRKRAWENRELVFVTALTYMLHSPVFSHQVAVAACAYADRYMNLATESHNRHPGWVMGAALLTASSMYLDTEELVYIADITPSLLTYAFRPLKSRVKPALVGRSVPGTHVKRVTLFQRRFLETLDYALWHQTAVDYAHDCVETIAYSSQEARNRVLRRTLDLIVINQLNPCLRDDERELALAALVVAHDEFGYPTESLAVLAESDSETVQSVRDYAILKQEIGLLLANFRGEAL